MLKKEDTVIGIAITGILQLQIQTGEAMQEARPTITTIHGDGVLLGVGADGMAAIILIGDMADTEAGISDFPGVGAAHGDGAPAGIWDGDILHTGATIHIGVGADITAILIGATEDIGVADITHQCTEEVALTEEVSIPITEDLPASMA